MAEKKDSKLWIDCVAGSELRDTQGEILSVEGADIAALERGEGRWNDNHGKGFFNSVGRITEAKKIFKSEDCENDRHTYYWNKIKAPFIYAKGYLYNDEEHPNAKAAAAILRNIHKTDAPLKIKASVEGGVLQRGLRDTALLAKTKIHSVALTFTPANQATLVEPLNLEKSEYDVVQDEILIKSVMPMAMENVPSFLDISERMSLEKIARSVEQARQIIKTLKTTNDQEELKKNLKAIRNLATAVAMMQAAHFMGGQGDDKKPVAEKPKQEVVRDVAGVDISKKTKNPYVMNAQELVDHIKDDHPHLWALAHNESSGGINMDHKKMKSGMHKGHTAGGPWAMMPKTVKFVIDKLDKDGTLSDMYPHVKAYTDNVDKHHKDITDTLNSSPMLSFKLAAKLYGHMNKKHGGDVDKVAHSWLHGLQGTKNMVAEQGSGVIQDHPYVQKFHSHLDKLNKALTAGYGYAGSPTNLSGGGVMQSESVLGGPTNGTFKYITCDDCGKEQVHHANQVKCRECGKSFSFEKIFKLIS